ncbi:uncharacterized protein LOC144158581 isoform X3 [Haemaphysalis longicornis]
MWCDIVGVDSGVPAMSTDGACSQQTQAAVATGTRGTQCAPRLLISITSQTEQEFPACQLGSIFSDSCKSLHLAKLTTLKLVHRSRHTMLHGLVETFLGSLVVAPAPAVHPLATKGVFPLTVRKSSLEGSYIPA